MDFDDIENDKRFRQLYDQFLEAIQKGDPKAGLAPLTKDEIAEVEAARAKEVAARHRVKPKMTATEKKHYRELMQLVPNVMMDFHWPELAGTFLPEEWAGITADPQPTKTRITLRVDTDVARFYRKLGRGHQKVMNDVLRTFMLARLVEILGIGAQPLELMMAQDAKQKTALEREERLLRELEAVRRKRVGIG